MNGIEAVISACSRVLDSRIDAQFINRLLIFSTTPIPSLPLCPCSPTLSPLALRRSRFCA